MRRRAFLTLLAGAALCPAEEPVFVPLFPEDGEPRGWRVRNWADVKNDPQQPSPWLVKDGVLHGSEPRGTWLVSEREYGDFKLEFEFLLGERGNSGLGLRFPPAGDPAFDGIELQMVDPRYYPSDYSFDPAELTGGLYKALPPRAQLYKPNEWNRYEITCRGALIKVMLNRKLIQDVDLTKETRAVERGLPLAQRPRRGHLGFQELSRGGAHVQIRGARIKELTTSEAN